MLALLAELGAVPAGAAVLTPGGCRRPRRAR